MDITAHREILEDKTFQQQIPNVFLFELALFFLSFALIYLVFEIEI